MKKIFLLALSVLALNVNAATDDEVALEPITATAGAANLMWVNVNLPSYDTELRAINVDIQFPDGFTVGTTVQDFGEGCKWDYDFDEAGTATNWAASGSKKTDNGTYYHFTVYATKTTTPFHGSEGHLIQLKVKTPSTPGVYPVKMLASTYCAKSDKKTDNIYWTTAQTSYVVVGDASGASLKAEGSVPSFVTTALNSETAISYLDVKDATVNGTLDPNDMVVAGAASSSYKRSVGDGNYATVCLPMALTGSYYTVKLNDAKTAITLTEAENLPANTPAVVKGDISASTDSYVTLGTPAVGEGNLTGTYETYTLADAAGYYLAKNNFYADGATVKPYRAYIDTPAAVKVLKVYIEDATGIHEITDQLSDEDIYTLQGIRVNKAQKGINIIGGKKVYNK